jgi:activator of 2-hydroxyglutaryl-CoA dehydratase
MVKRIGIRPTVMMTGGVAKNSGVVAAFRKELNIEVVIPPNLDSQLVGALGAALIAQEMSKNAGSGRG